METEQNISFNIYRYQILPLTQTLQLSFLSDIKSIEDLKNRKNELFNEAIESLKKLEYARSEIIHKIIYHDDQFSIIKLGHQKLLNITDKSFQEEKVEDWTPIFIIINNNPDVQKVFIEKNRKIFTNTETVARILENNLTAFLKKYNLGVYFEPLFGEEEFWNIVDKYPSSIVQICFELISPNLSNISEALTLDLEQLHKDTNTKKTNLELNSEKESNLTVPRDNEMINGLVQYASKGGGDISVKIKGMRRRIKMSKSVTEIEVEEMNLKSKNIDMAIPFLTEILK